MAFGGLKGTLTGSANSITNPMVASGSVVVAVGDLVTGILSQQTSLTAAGTVTDNLGNTYAYINAGIDAGTVTGRYFYARVTVAGTLTTVNVPATSSTNDASVVVDVIEGPFKPTVALDTSPPAASSDASTPFDCPSSGTLDEPVAVVIGYIAYGGNATVASTAPSTLGGTVARANASCGLSRRVVSSTSAVAPQFTATSADAALGTAAFIWAPNFSPATGDLALSPTAPTAAQTDHRDLTPAAGNLALSSTAPSSVVDIRRDPASANLVLSTTAPTVGLTSGVPTEELREDGAQELREDGGIELREQNDAFLYRPAAGNLTLSTTAPTAARTDNRDISPAAGNLVLSTTAPTATLSDNRDISPAVADLTLSSTAPTAARTDNLYISPAAADLILSTTAPTAVRTDNRDISPTAGDLTLSTTAPTVDVATSGAFIPATANLTLSATAPTVALSDNKDISPSAADLTLSSTTPTVEVTTGVDIDVSPDAANLVLSTFAPTVSVGVGSVQKDSDPDYWKMRGFHVEGETFTERLRKDTLGALDEVFSAPDSVRSARTAARAVREYAKASGALLSDNEVTALELVADQLRSAASQRLADAARRSAAEGRALLIAHLMMQRDEEEALFALDLY